MVVSRHQNLRTKIPKIWVLLGDLAILESSKFGSFGGFSRGKKFYRLLAEALVMCLLNGAKYQSHVRVRVRFRSGSVSGSVSGSCPVRGWVSVRVRDRVRVRVRVCLVSGFVFGSCLGSCLVRIWVCVWFVSGSCQVRVRFVSGSCLLRVCFGYGFVSGSYSVAFIS